MKKEEIEKVLVKSFDYYKSILGNHIDIGELKFLSEWIMSELKEEMEVKKESKRNYIVSGHQLSQLLTSGRYEFKDIFGNTIQLIYEDQSNIPLILESGNIVICANDGSCDEHDTRDSECDQGTTSARRSTVAKEVEQFLNTNRKQSLFKLHLDMIDDLLYLCIEQKWDDKLDFLQKIRSDIMREKMKQHVSNGEQTTLSDFAMSSES